MNAATQIQPRARPWVRGILLAFTAGLIAIFAFAVWINPYDEDGRPLTMGAHQRLGMPPCEFVVIFKKPCPSCGLTTSFSLLMHGDLVGSMRANSVGTAMALFGLALIPWSLLIALRGRYVWVRSIERASLWAAGVFFCLLLIRWAIVIM